MSHKGFSYLQGHQTTGPLVPKWHEIQAFERMPGSNEDAHWLGQALGKGQEAAMTQVRTASISVSLCAPRSAPMSIIPVAYSLGK